jgi:hypothetical protein
MAAMPVSGNGRDNRPVIDTVSVPIIPHHDRGNQPIGLMPHKKFADFVWQFSVIVMV